MTTRIVGEQGVREIALESFYAVSQNVLRITGGRIQIADDRFDSPIVRVDKGVTVHLLKPSLPYHSFVVVGASTWFGMDRTLIPCRVTSRPFAEDVHDKTLP